MYMHAVGRVCMSDASFGRLKTFMNISSLKKTRPFFFPLCPAAHFFIVAYCLSRRITTAAVTFFVNRLNEKVFVSG